MPAPKLNQTYAAFVPEGIASAAREVKPASFAAYSLGTITNIETSEDNGEIVFDKPIAGAWRDYDVLTERDRLTFTLTVSELSAQIWKMIRSTTCTISGGAANYEPGNKLVTKGWLQVQSFTEAGTLVDTQELWVAMAIPSQSFSTGLATATITGRKLYSTLNSGSLANLTY